MACEVGEKIMPLPDLIEMVPLPGPVVANVTVPFVIYKVGDGYGCSYPWP